MCLLDAASRIGLCPINVKPPAVPGDIYFLPVRPKEFENHLTQGKIVDILKNI